MKSNRILPCFPTGLDVSYSLQARKSPVLHPMLPLSLKFWAHNVLPPVATLPHTSGSASSCDGTGRRPGGTPLAASALALERPALPRAREPVRAAKPGAGRASESAIWQEQCRRGRGVKHPRRESGCSQAMLAHLLRCTPATCYCYPFPPGRAFSNAWRRSRATCQCW